MLSKAVDRRKFNLPWNLSPRKIAKLFFVSILIAVFFHDCLERITFRRFVTHQTFGGDEPRYLRMVDSLAKDGDFDLSNIWRPTEQKEQAENEPFSVEYDKSHDLSFVGKNGGVYVIHMPGLSFLMLPAYVLDSFLFPHNPEKEVENLSFLPAKLVFTRILLAIIAVLSLILLFRLLDYFLSSLFLSFALTLVFILSSPFTGYAFEVYPAVSATFFSLLVLNAIFCRFRNNSLNTLFIISGIGFLPWLNQRFIALSLGLFVAFVFSRYKKPEFAKKSFVVGLSLLILSLPYFAYFYSLTGNPSPISTSKLHGKVYARWNTLPLGLFGNFFSRSHGFLWHYPWIILFFFGVYLSSKKNKKQAFTLLLVFIPYYLACSAAIPWGGVTRPVGRYLLPVFPLFLVFSARAILNILKKFSFGKVVFYSVFFFLIFLNKRNWFIRFDFGSSYISPQDLRWIIESILIIVFMYLSLFLSERYLFPENARDFVDVFRKRKHRSL